MCNYNLFKNNNKQSMGSCYSNISVLLEQTIEKNDFVLFKKIIENNINEFKNNNYCFYDIYSNIIKLCRFDVSYQQYVNLFNIILVKNCIYINYVERFLKNNMIIINDLDIIFSDQEYLIYIDEIFYYLMRNHGYKNARFLIQKFHNNITFNIQKIYIFAFDQENVECFETYFNLSNINYVYIFLVGCKLDDMKLIEIASKHCSDYINEKLINGMAVINNFSIYEKHNIMLWLSKKNNFDYSHNFVIDKYKIIDEKQSWFCFQYKINNKTTTIASDNFYDLANENIIIKTLNNSELFSNEILFFSKKINEKNNDIDDCEKCPICLIKTNDIITNCTHKYCLSCIIKCKNNSEKCPICRQLLINITLI